MSKVATNLKQLRGQIANLCASSSPPANVPTIVAVSKSRPFEDIAVAYQDTNQRDFGENRIQELLDKAIFFSSKKTNDIRWHFIGRLQSNKINALLKVPHLRYLHSVDSLKILQLLFNKFYQGHHQLTSLDFFLQVNTSEEEEKSGFINYQQLKIAVEWILSKQNNQSPPSALKLSWIGLMTMGRIRSKNFQEDALGCFQLLQRYRNNLVEDFGTHLLPFLPLKLSMGMSDDYQQAIKCGSDFIRIGHAIFSSGADPGHSET